MPIRGIDFSTLTLVDALDLAILVEAEAQERYEEFAQQMEQHRTPEAAAFFRHMAGNEAKHGQELTVRRVMLFPDAPRTVSPAALYDVEAPDYDAARAFMSPRRAMQAALASELKARQFFEAALPGLKDSQVRTLFQELRDEEIEHHALVLAELDKLPPDSGISDEEFVDEPAPM
jgi:rubrerythrin